MSIRTIIIDDDPFMRDLLSDKLEQHVTDAEILGTAGSGTEGLALIESVEPELVFLDVEMGDMTGFEMLGQLDEVPFSVIFITSFGHYAIKAIRFNALDYLMKPIDLGELRLAMDRYRENAKASSDNPQVKQALSNMRMQDPGDEMLTLQLQDQELRIQLKEIVRIEGERNYSCIFAANGEKHLTSKTLGTFEDLLLEKGFFRNHKSHLLNGTHISQVNRDLTVDMSDGSNLPISRRKKDAFKEWYQPS